MQKSDLQSLYNVIKAATDIADQVANIIADKKITWGEALSLVGQTGNFQLIVSQGPAAVRAYLSTGDQDREDALNYLAEQLELPSQIVDAKVDATIRYIGHLETHIRGSITAIIGIKTTWEDAGATL